MKNLYLYIALLYVCFSGYCQQNLQNANWYFGYNAAASFLPDPYTPTFVNGSAMTVAEGCASVSNQAGQLLFYTDGTTVWNKNHQVMTNGTGLLGHFSNTQLVIIPRPKYPNNYYIITIDGKTAGVKGLYYTEVDMSVGLGEVVLANKNKVFKDHNDTAIDLAYQNLSEKVTSTVHSNGADYWMVAQVNNNIYSYHITPAGPTITPSSVTPSLFDLATDPLSGAGEMKISPNTQHIGICYSGFLTPGKVYTGEFNNTTGLVTLNPNALVAPSSFNLYGLEFSPSSQYVYFSTFYNIYHSSSTALRPASANSGAEEEKIQIYRADMNDRTTELISELTIPIEENIMQTNAADPIPSSNKFLSLQLAINKKIYLAKDAANVGVIDTPDDYLNPNVLQNAIVITSGSCRLGLPQWVHWQTKSCEDNIVLVIPDMHSSPYTYEYTNFITTQTNYKVNSTQEITLQAGNHVLLNPDTVIETGSLFVAQIGECIGNTNMTSFESRGISIDEQEAATVNGFIVYPNPTNGMLTIKSPTAQAKMSVFVITDVTGKELMRVNNQSQNETQLDLSTLSSGIYFLSADGIPVQKIIKN